MSFLSKIVQHKLDVKNIPLFVCDYLDDSMRKQRNDLPSTQLIAQQPT